MKFWFLAGWVLAGIIWNRKKVWLSKGIKNGWIKEETDKVQTIIHQDIAGDRVVNKFVDTIAKVTDCPEEVKPRLRNLTRKILIAEYLKTAYSETTIDKKGINISFRFDSGKLILEITVKKQVIIKKESDWFPVIVMLILLAIILVFTKLLIWLHL